MDILEHTLAVMLRADAQILLVLLRPQPWKLLHVQILLHQLLLQLIPHQDVQAVA